jgi:DNA-binding transcriptional LysR family regulator
MELRSLKYFQAVYEQRSVSGAARQCFVSQPSITTAIQQLESTLDTRLFVRHARGVLPTPAADKLYPIAKEMSDKTQSILNLFSGGPTPVPLRLGLMRSLGAQRMSYLLKKLTKRIDNLEITLVDPEEPCDVRVVLSQSKARNENFVAIWQDHYQLALPKDWPLADKDKITLSDLDAMPFINRSPCDVLDKLKLMMSHEAIQFQPRANIRTIEYAWQLVSAGIGAALLPDWQEISESEELILKPIENVNLHTDIGLAFKTNTQNSSLINAVKEVCIPKPLDNAGFRTSQVS